jgi:hypothetical protein
MERSGGLDGGGKTESLLQPFNNGPIELYIDKSEV